MRLRVLANRWGSLVLVWMAIVGCGRKTDFVTHVPVQPSLTHAYEHSLKEMQGNDKVDILFVVDNSSSMGDSQANLKSNASIFIDKFVKQSHLNWQMGIVSTDLRNPPFLGMVPGDSFDKTTSDAVKKFGAAVDKLGLAGDTTERPFAATVNALKNFPGFIRPRGVLAVIIVTDAEEQSQMKGADFLRELQNFEGMGGTVIVYGVLGTADLGCPGTQETQYIYATSPYHDAIEPTGGKLYQLCKDFGPALADLGNDLVRRVARPAIQLRSRPYMNTIKVFFHGTELPGGPAELGGYWFYDFDLNRIVFHNLDFAPGENEYVTIQYDSHTEVVDLK